MTSSMALYRELIVAFAIPSITCWGSPQFVANAMSLRIDTYYPLLFIQWASESFPVP